MYSFYESVRSKKYGRTSTNMYLQYKWDIENLANHRYKVKTAKPSIDNEAPLTFTHLFVRPKKLQLELERYSTIQRNNRFLLERLATIQREGAWIDNKNTLQSRSLNTWKRQQDMIQLAYNNQIMIGRLQDVKAQHNRTKLEDEYLINQKYKANIQKWPPNWKELQKHLNRVKADIFKKVFDSKYQSEAYRKSRKKVLQKWALETDKHAAAKAEKDAQKAIEAEREKEIAKEKKKKASSERKKAVEEWVKSSEKWRSARDERLESIAKSEKRKAEEAEKKKLEIQKREAKRRQREKEELKQLKEEKKKQKEEEREKLKSDQYKQGAEKMKKERKSKQIKAKPKQSLGFEVELNDLKKDYEKRKEPSISDAGTTKLKKEKSSIDPTIETSAIDETLLAEDDISATPPLTDAETEKMISDDGIRATEQTDFGKEGHSKQRAIPDYKDPTTEDHIPGHETVAEKQVDSEKIPTTGHDASSQEILATKDTSSPDISSTTVPDDDSISKGGVVSDNETVPDDESVSKGEVKSENEMVFGSENFLDNETIPDNDAISENETTFDEQSASENETISENEGISDSQTNHTGTTVSEDESSITEENISDKESLTTDKTNSDEESP